MFLRMLVSQLVRQTAEQKIRAAVSDAARARGFSPVGEQTEAEDGSLPEPEPLPPCDVAFIFALGVESGSFVDLLSDTAITRCPSFLEHAGQLDGRSIIVADGGVGREAAERATDDVIAIHRPAWVVSAGFAGSLQKEVRRGHIVMADRIVDCDGTELAVGLKMEPQVVEATKGLHVGGLLTVDRIIRAKDEKLQLGEEFNALACDMESLAVADVCRRKHVRFLSVRVISDGVDDHLPPEIEYLIGRKSLARKLGAAAGAILKRPSSVKDLWKLQEDAQRASERLAKFLTGVIPQLATQVESS